MLKVTKLIMELLFGLVVLKFRFFKELGTEGITKDFFHIKSMVFINLFEYK